MTKRFYVAALAVGLLAAVFTPLALASSAHPHTHNYYGTHVVDGMANVKIQETGTHAKIRADATLVGGCFDFVPIAHTTIPPNPVRDLDPETGFGGGCFPFETVYGDDTGSVLGVYVAETYPVIPVWLACVDIDGDGICSGAFGDEVDLCWTGGGNAGSASLTNPGSACSVYAAPYAKNPNVFVIMLGAAEVNNREEPPARIISAALNGIIALR